jgi:hypothetical protein
VHHDLLASRRQARPVAGLASRPEEVGVHEVRDDFDALGGHREVPYGLALEIVRYRREPIGLQDGELRDGLERRVEAHEGDVGAVQRRDDAEFPLPLQHLAGKERRRGVGDGVVHVHQVELVFASRVV